LSSVARIKRAQLLTVHIPKDRLGNEGNSSQREPGPSRLRRPFEPYSLSDVVSDRAFRRREDIIRITTFLADTMRSTTRAASPLSLLALIVPIIFVTLFMAMPTASAASQVSNPNEETLRTYCKAHYGAQADVKLVEPNAYGWLCQKPNKTLVGINMHAVCAESNAPTPRVIDWFDERSFANWAHAWGCVQLSHVTKGLPLDMNQACKKFGNKDGAVLRGVGRQTVADWMCKDGKGESEIRLRPACEIMYGRGTWEDFVVPRFNYWDPYSITCWS
jgi:hypothetical protein